jgi:hypothetical protein
VVQRFKIASSSVKVSSLYIFPLKGIFFFRWFSLVKFSSNAHPKNHQGRRWFLKCFQCATWPISINQIAKGRKNSSQVL